MSQPPQHQQVPHDRPEQLQMILSGLMEGETAIVVYDCIGVGTGFVGLTDQRVILQDKSFVGGKMAITSLPYSRVQAVSMLSDKSIIKWGSTSAIALHAGGAKHEATFRGEEKARYVHDVVLWHITR